MSEERKPPDTDSEEDGKCSISITVLKLLAGYHFILNKKSK